jgi:murein DD-endopeptidase MepM/ murein hydrolase activator NlpD
MMATQGPSTNGKTSLVTTNGSLRPKTDVERLSEPRNTEPGDDLTFSEDILNEEEEMEQNSAAVEWLESRGNECYRSKQNSGFCQGPLRVPKPHGSEAALADELGLGQVDTVSRLLTDSPEKSWVQAAAYEEEDEIVIEDKLLWPVPDGIRLRGYGKVGSGRRRHLHKGIDIGAEEGALIFAVERGIVAYSNNQIRGYGNLLVIVHPDASVAFYAHTRALYVFAGQRVRRGQLIGEVGRTGFARAPHLHFEYRKKGRPVNLGDVFSK